MNCNQLFIEPEIDISPDERQRASYLRREFVIDRGIKSAALTLSACGLYQAYISDQLIAN